MRFSPASPRKLHRREYMKHAGTAAKALALRGIGAYAASHFTPRASALYPGANIEIFKALVAPAIDGKYDMTPQEVEVDGNATMIDEWGDAFWIQLQKNSGSLTAFAGFKYDDQFLYIADDVPSITEENFDPLIIS